MTSIKCVLLNMLKLIFFIERVTHTLRKTIGVILPPRPDHCDIRFLKCPNIVFVFSIQMCIKRVNIEFTKEMFVKIPL